MFHSDFAKSKTWASTSPPIITTPTSLSSPYFRPVPQNALNVRPSFKLYMLHVCPILPLHDTQN